MCPVCSVSAQPCRRGLLERLGTARDPPTTRCICQPLGGRSGEFTSVPRTYRGRTLPERIVVHGNRNNCRGALLQSFLAFIADMCTAVISLAARNAPFPRVTIKLWNELTPKDRRFERAVHVSRRNNSNNGLLGTGLQAAYTLDNYMWLGRASNKIPNERRGNAVPCGVCGAFGVAVVAAPRQNLEQ